MPRRDGPILDALGLALRPVERTVAAGVCRLAESGHLDPAERAA